MTGIESLVEHAGPAVVNRPGGFVVSGSGKSHEGALTDLLALKNGFFAFDSALHVFSCGAGELPPGLDIERWNSDGLWRSSYDDLADGFYFFAQDIFGSQFCLSDQGILLWDSEVGSADIIAPDLEGWAQAILDDSNYLTGQSLAQEWFSLGRTLQPTERLVPRKPFVLGGEFTVENLAALDSIESMKFRGDLAVQLRDIPDGSDVQLTFDE